MGTALFTILLILCLSMRPVASGNALKTRRGNAFVKENPCVDFYKYVCAKWLKTAVPRGIATWKQLEEGTIPAKRKIAKYLERAVKDQDIYPVKWAKIHFQACTNETALNEMGMRPLANIVNRVGGGEWNILEESPKKDWVAVHNTYSQMTGKGALFTIEVGPDKNLKENVLIISPTEELFLRDISKSNQEDIHQYEEFLTDIWMAYPKEHGHRTDASPAIKNTIKEVLRFREEIIEKRILIRGLPKMTVMKLSELQELTWRNMRKRHLDWPRFLQSTFRNLGNFKFGSSTSVHIREPDYLNVIFKAIASSSAKVLLNHIHFHFVERFIQYTSVGMNAMFHHVLKRPLPTRSINCITSDAMRIIVNYIYVQKFVTNYHIRTAAEIAHKVRDILERQISKTTWVDEETAGIAMLKISKIKQVIGYDSWYSKEKNVIDYYSRMAITRNYLMNVLDFESTSYRDALRRLRTPVTEQFDKHSTDPFGVSATYNYQTNTIVIPAGLLRQPYFDEPYIDYHYGGLGTNVGYVMSRSLDSLGRQYDQKGNQGNWWRSDTLNAYKERLQCYSKRFKEAILRAKLNFTQVDGDDYLDEIVAEYMGLVATFEAYQSAVRRTDINQDVYYGHVNQRQMFFVTYGMRHCEAISARFLAEMEADAHLPRLRLNTAVSNMQAFADAFRCKENDPMNPSRKCEFLDESSILNSE